MLNELNKNHMSGVDNHGGDDAFYDLGDAWDRPSNFPTKPLKVYKCNTICTLVQLHKEILQGFHSYNNSYKKKK